MDLKRIHHVAYRCKDAKETVEFYQRVLNMDFTVAFAEDKVPSTKEPDPYMHVFLDAGMGNVLAFFELPTRPDMGRDENTPEWVQHIAFEVENYDALLEAKAHVESEGIDVIGPTNHGIFQSIYFFDPNGHRLELVANTQTQEQIDELKRVAPDMLEEWSRTKKAPRHDLSRYVGAEQVAGTLQEALDNWADAEPVLAEIAASLENGAGENFDPADCKAPLPRAYQWADGSAYVNHVELVRKARGAEMPESFWTDPLMYQGGSDSFIGPQEPILAASEDWGIDFEAEVTVVTDDVPMGVSAEDALSHIKLIMIVNDVSLRNLIPGELAKGFGFFQSKPSSAFSPVAVTPNELGDAWQDGKLHLPLLSFLNGEPFGKPDAGVDMTFDFGQLIAHAAKSRPLGTGTIIGSGTISNKLDDGPGKPIAEGGVGYSCIAEIRTIETIESGKPKTSFLEFGDRVRIEMNDAQGNSIFGAIDHEVAKY
jgi:fumarylacetoacetate (FAA) hydrolase